MRHIWMTCVAMLAVAGTSFAATINVPADYSTIQEAIDAASDGDTIAIAAGTYFERDINTNGKAILISGAVDADGAPAAIIDGQEQLGTVLVCNSSENAETIIENLMVINAFGVRGAAMACIESSPTIQNCVFRNGFCAYGGGIYCESSSPTISGCTISGNTAHVNGGGIYCESSSPAISGCTISGNTAKFDDDYYGGGGGIYCYESSPTLTDCVISDNSANLCGGIYCQNDSNPTLTNCEISGNTADSHGSGIVCWDSSPTISSCTISGNTATYNCGGISFIGNSSPTLSDCTISGNTADYGGGIFASDTSNATLTNCTISGNTAHVNGGGIYCQSYSNLTLIDTNVCGNDIDQIYGVWTNGGGVCIAFACEDWDDDGVPDKCQGSIGDGIHEVPSEYATIQSAIEAAGYGDTVLVGPGTYTNTGNWVINPGGKPITIQSTDGPGVTILDGEGVRRVVQCAGGETAATTIEGFTITGGSAYYGGGIYFAGGNPTLTDCVIDGNTAEYNGGGIYCYKSSPTLTDCEISNNTAEYDGGSMDGGGGGIYCYINSSPTITDCTITNNTAWYGGGIHCHFSNGNPTLAYTTVCGNTLDQINGNWTDNGGNTIADECPDCPDINGDGEVGVDEILAVIAAWDTDDADADVNYDGIVDIEDLLIVISAWGPCP